MRPIRPVAPYLGSESDSVNASLSLAKLRRRIRLYRPTYKHTSRYQAKIAMRRAAHRMHPGVVR